MNDHAAVDAGNTILRESNNEHLKQIAQTVIDTHTKMLEQLEGEAQSAGVPMPNDGGPIGKAICSKLEALGGKALEKTFVEDMVRLHKTELKHLRQRLTTESQSHSGRFLKTSFPF